MYNCKDKNVNKQETKSNGLTAISTPMQQKTDTANHQLHVHSPAELNYDTIR